MSKAIIVVFKRSWRGYSAGETAGFDEAAAEALVKSGTAELSGGKKSPKPNAGADKKPAATAGGSEQDQGDQSGGQQDQQQDEEKP